MKSSEIQPGLPRIMAAALYDLILTMAVLFLATALWLPFTSGRAIAPQSLPFEAYLLSVWFIFFGWCWTHGGQTLGMQAWKLKVYSKDTGPVTWRQAGIRFLMAIPAWTLGGLGVFWRMMPPRHETWHDLASGTYFGWAD